MPHATLTNIEWMVLKCLANHKKEPNLVPMVTIDPAPDRWSRFVEGVLVLPSSDQALRYAKHAEFRMKGLLPYLDVRVGTSLGYGIHMENLIWEELIPLFRQEVDDVDELEASLKKILPENAVNRPRNRL